MKSRSANAFMSESISLMTKSLRLGTTLIALVGASAVVYACSSEASRPGSQSVATSAPSVKGAATDGVETARIQSYLDSFYKREDVVHSFRSRLGEDIDCIDFLAQPAARRMIAAGQAVPIPPALPSPSSTTLQALERVGFAGEPDESGNPRRCPGTTVPMLRKSMAQIKQAGGLTKYLRLRAHAAEHPPPSGSTTPADDSGFFHVVAKYPIPPTSSPICGTGGCLTTNDGSSPPCGSGRVACPPEPVFGGSAIFSVYAPVSDPNGHSLAQTWTFSGAGLSNLTSCQQCTSDCSQTIEMGWMVDPTMFPNNNPGSPHLFVYSTQDGYWNTGGYAEDPGAAPNCACMGVADMNCFACGEVIDDPFLLVPAASGQPQFTPGMTISKSDGLVNPSQLPSVVNGKIVVPTPTELTFATTWFDLPIVGPTWALSVNGVIFGEYPGSAFVGGAVPNDGTLANAATYFWAGGEVSGASGTAFNQSSPSIGQMGSGYGGVVGYGWSSYIRNFEFIGQNGAGGTETVSTSLFTIAETNPNCYSVGAGFDGIPSVGSPAPGGSNWGNYMFFGGLGHQCGSGWSSFPGSCDSCCTFVPSNVETTPSTCPSTLAPGQACDSYCNQPPPPGGLTPDQQLVQICD